MDSRGPRDPGVDGPDYRTDPSDRPGRRYGFGNWSRNLGGQRLSSGTAILSAVTLALVGFGLGIGLALAAASAVPPELLSDPTWILLLSLVPLQGVAFPLTALAYVRVRQLPLSYFRARTPSLYDVLIGFGGFVLAIGLVFSASLVIAAVGVETAQRSDQELLMNPDVLQILIPASLLVIGPGEELLFRGTIQSTLRESFGAPVAILLASALFAPAHVIALSGGLQGLAVSIAVLFLPSVVFGAVYEYTENLVVPALSHGLYNALLFSLLYVAVTSGEVGLLLP